MRKLGILCWIIAVYPTYAQSADESAVRAVVDQLLAGMRQGDSALVHQFFLPEARLHTVSDDATLHRTSLDQLLTAVGTPHNEVWDERITDCRIRIDGPLATAWTPYRFYRGEAFSHCGTNAFQLYRSADGWKILQITDTRRTDHCE